MSLVVKIDYKFNRTIMNEAMNHLFIHSFNIYQVLTMKGSVQDSGDTVEFKSEEGFTLVELTFLLGRDG